MSNALILNSEFRVEPRPSSIELHCTIVQQWGRNWDLLLIFQQNVCSSLYKSDNLQYNTMERWIDGMIVPPAYGPRFILIDWE